MVRTIEAVLGLDPLNLNDAVAKTMLDVFTTSKEKRQFYAEPSTYLYGTQLLPPDVTENRKALHPTHDAAYWANVTKGLNFSSEDLLDGEAYNKILWDGLMGGKPFPTRSTGLDLRQNRQEL